MWPSVLDMSKLEPCQIIFWIRPWTMLDRRFIFDNMYSITLYQMILCMRHYDFKTIISLTFNMFKEDLYFFFMLYGPVGICFGKQFTM